MFTQFYVVVVDVLTCDLCHLSSLVSPSELLAASWQLSVVGGLMAQSVVLIFLSGLTLVWPPGPLVQAVSCRDGSGQELDWWIVYKLPKSKSHGRKKWRRHNDKHHKTDRYRDEGTSYAYLTSAMPGEQWRLADVPISDPASLPGRTLEPLYGPGGREMFSLMYNDEHPHGPTSVTRGHTKGVVVGDRDSSIWLVHSVPHYPPYPNESYSYPHTGLHYGQTALCLSLGSDQLEVVGRQLGYNAPYIYQVNLPAWVSQYPDMVKAASGKHVRRPPYFNTELLTTSGGEKFVTFAKYSDFGKDLYADLVAPVLKVPLLVESWPNGPGKMPSRCSGPFIVENIDEMEFHELNDDDFKTTKDHSKWAISLDKKRPYVCIGDINRMETQRRRGGGTACFSSPTVWKTFKKSVKAIEAC